MIAACLAALVVAPTRSWSDPLTKFNAPTTFPIGGPKVKLADGASCSMCESGPFWVDAFDNVQVDCDGSCDVQLVCRPSGSQHDAVLASYQLTDAAQQFEPAGTCDNAYFQIKACAASSKPCAVRAWKF